MKICSKCKQIKELNEFSKCKTFKDGYQYQCRQCKKNPEYDKQHYQDNIKSRSEYHKQRRQNDSEFAERVKQQSKKQFKSNKLNYHIVYLLLDHNYVGVTDNPTHRMYHHKNVYKRNTDNWIELARFNNREDALKYEATKHAEGYDGAKQVISGICA